MFQLPDDNVDFECPWGEHWKSSGGVVAMSLPEPQSAPETLLTSDQTPAPTMPPHSREALQAAAKKRQSSSRGGGCGCGRK